MPRLIAPLVIGLLGTAILVSLGAWQMQRLEWKRGIIDRIEARLEAGPVALPDPPNPENDQYRRVALEGALLPGELHVYTSAPPWGVGYRVVAPFETVEGRRILVDLGFVPIAEKDVTREARPLDVEGSLLWPEETDRFTSPPDLEANIWFARDVTLMAEALGTEPLMVVLARSSVPLGPVAMPVTVNLRNEHLGYAVTWFGLAIVWAGMTLYWVWRINDPSDEGA